MHTKATNKLKGLVKKYSKKHRLHGLILGSAILISSLVLLITIVQTPQEIRQHAQAVPPVIDPKTSPNCSAKNGLCSTVKEGCYEELGETNVGKMDCAQDQVCCAVLDAKPTTAPFQQEPTSSPMASATDVPQATATNAPTITVIPSIEINTSISLTVLLHGIGNSGDSRNTANNLSIKTPKHASREFTITISNNNQTVKTETVQLTYKDGAYTGSVDLGTQWVTGQYDLKIKTQSFMEANITNRNITAGVKTPISGINLISGDINGDNILSALDYNGIVTCYNLIILTTDCDITKKQMADLNDDGAVDGVDYNLLLREMAP